jgi:hypothetical protein
MNRTETDRPEIDLNSIDPILAAEEPLLPSSGFLASVMERVREEAVAPPPIPFPWKRALPGMTLLVGVFGWGFFEFVRGGLPTAAAVSVAIPHLSASEMQTLEQAGWVGFALGVSLLSWLLSRRLVGRTGLL